MLARIAVFVSGGGSNLQSIIDAGISVACVISSQDGIFALERAKKASIPSFVYKKKDYTNVNAMFAAIDQKLQTFGIDLIVLAGYLTVIPACFVAKYARRIINIHPSLIPAFAGDGFYGMRVHHAVIEAKAPTSGATVHFVDEGVDTGDIIIQESVPVLDTDTPDTLAARVLEVEHKILPMAIKQLINLGGK
jgi:phosphoribosylglycinamide formyltransferase-1